MMVISSKFHLSVHLDHIKIGESSISPSETVGNLGVIMDSNYTMVSDITATRLVTRTRKFDHITPVLQDLHWLPIKSRSKFKILLLVYKCLYGLAPSYLSKRLSLKLNPGLRSDDKLVLNVPTTKLKTKTYGDRCFSIAGPNLWNQLPSHIRLSKSFDVFKRSLKTHLFKDVFNL